MFRSSPPIIVSSQHRKKHLLLQTVASRSLAYTVNESDRTFMFHVKVSSFPNFSGTDQKRNVKSVTADALIFQNMALPNAGTNVELIYRRDK